MRIKEIDIAKGIGILLVVLGHLLSDVGGVLHDWIYSFHMPLFFILSGVVLPERIDVKKLTYKLLVPYLLWPGLATFYELTKQPDVWKSVIGINIINTVSTYGIAPFWFLAALYVSDILIIYGKRVRYCIPIAAIIFTFVVSGACTGVLGNAVLAVVRNMYAASFVLLGKLLKSYIVLYSKKDEGLKILLITVISLIISVASSVLNSGVNMHKLILGNPILFLISAISGSIVVINVSIMIKDSKELECIGKNSMGIMCLHYKTIPLWGLVMLIPFEGSARIIIQMGLLIVVSLYISILLKKFIPLLLGGYNGKQV